VPHPVCAGGGGALGVVVRSCMQGTLDRTYHCQWQRHMQAKGGCQGSASATQMGGGMQSRRSASNFRSLQQVLGHVRAAAHNLPCNLNTQELALQVV
jgi:hypothetical protein